MTTTLNAWMKNFKDFLLFLILVTMVIVWLMSLTSCVTYKRCMDKYATTTTDTVFSTITDTLALTTVYHVPYENVTGIVRLQSRYDSMIVVSDAGRVRAKFWYDKYNSLRFMAECLPDTVVKDTVIIRTIEVPVQVNTNTFEPKKKVSWIEQLAMNIGGAVLLITFLVVMIWLAKKAVTTWFPALKLFRK